MSSPRHLCLLALTVVALVGSPDAQQVLDSNHTAVVQFLTTDDPTIVPVAGVPYVEVTDSSLPSGKGILIDCTVVQAMLASSLSTSDAYLKLFQSKEKEYVAALQLYLLEPTPAQKAKVDALEAKMEFYANLHHAFESWSWACDNILRAAGC